MDFFSLIWQVYLYQPLVNALVYLYNTIAHQNLGWAVIYLTALLRVVLLPLSIMSERNKILYERMELEIAEVERHHRADPVYLKEHIRRLTKKYHMRPWAKTVVLGIQLLVLVLLYQVFITGIQGAQLAKILYTGVEYPGRLNTEFMSVQYGASPKETIVFDVGERSAVWAGLVFVVLFIEILIRLKNSSGKTQSVDLVYLVAFPAISFAVLWYLPMVKSLFILTSLAFSYLLIIFRLLFFRTKKDGAH